MVDKDVLIKLLAHVNTILVISFIFANFVCLILPGENSFKNVIIAESVLMCVGNISILIFLIIECWR